MRALRIEIVDRASRKRAHFAFSASPVKVGRGRMNDLVLDFDFVSQLHGAISFSDEEAVFMDLGSRNGTIIDGAKAKKNRSIRLASSPRLQIGTLELAFSWDDGASSKGGTLPPAENTAGRAIFAAPPTGNDEPPSIGGRPKRTRVLDEAPPLPAAPSPPATLPPALAPPAPALATPAAKSQPPELDERGFTPPSFAAVGVAAAVARLGPPLVSLPPLAPLTPPAPLSLPPPAAPFSQEAADRRPELAQEAPSLSLPWSRPESAHALAPEPPPPSAAPEPPAADPMVVTAFSFSRPAAAPPAPSPRNGASPIETGALSRAFARELLELRLGLSSVAEDLGLPALSLPGALGPCDAPDEVLQQLAGRGRGATSEDELARAYAFLFAHHVSVVGALRECVDDLVVQSSPGGKPDPARIAGVVEAFRFSYRSIMAGQGFQPAQAPSLASTAPPSYAVPVPAYAVPSAPIPLPAPDEPTAASVSERTPHEPLPRGLTFELPPDLLTDSGKVPLRKLTHLGEEPQQAFLLSKPRVTIGRQDDADLPLRFPAVSRLHAELTQDPKDAGLWSVTDLGSSNGTFVNGTQTRSVRLKVGDIIQIGPVQLQFS